MQFLARGCLNSYFRMSSVKTGGLEVGTGNDTIVEENEKAGMADGCFLCSVCAGADLF